MSRASRIRLRPETRGQSEARAQLAEPGDLCIVVRGRPRLVVMKCPDGCGDDLTLNVDRAAGSAWRLYRGGKTITLYPSVWRTEGCRSHFILLRDKIIWANTPWDARTPQEEELLAVERAVTGSDASYWTLAERLDLLPWDVLDDCHELCRRGLLEEGETKGSFRKSNPSDR